MSQTTNQSDLSRRGFLKGLGGGLAGAAAVSTTLSHRDARAKNTGAAVRGPKPVSISLTVNGKKENLTVEPGLTLLDAIRDRLGLTGCKRVCNRGECGACTILLNGKTVLSCSILAIDADGGVIETVEGMQNGDVLHPVQQAFIEHDALQCGFCTSGFIVTCISLLRENPQPTLEQIKTGLSGNLCRCGTYPHIFAACAEAAKKMQQGG